MWPPDPGAGWQTAHATVSEQVAAWEPGPTALGGAGGREGAMLATAGPHRRIRSYTWEGRRGALGPGLWPAGGGGARGGVTALPRQGQDPGLPRRLSGAPSSGYSLARPMMVRM